MERKVWIKTSIGIRFPNCYIFLVGPPGGGKTVLTSLVKRMWMELEGHFLASDSLSPASLRDEMREAERRFMAEGLNLIQYNALAIGIDELGVLIPAYERELINQLVAWWDCEPFRERKRTKEVNYSIPKPSLNILGGCTPNFLKETLPEGAWDQGFCSRSLFIYSGETFPRDLFMESVIDKKLIQDLTFDLKQVAKLYGEMTFQRDAAEALNAWHLAGGEPRPDHPKLQNYNTRRTLHILKLMMVANASRGGDLILSLEDYRLAMDWLAEAEVLMPDIFKAMATGGDARVIEELHHYVYTLHVRDKKPVPEPRLINFLAERAPAHSVGKILEVVIRMGILLESYDPKLGRCFTPRPRKH